MSNMHNVGNGQTFLTRQDLERLPALWAEEPSPQTSGKYRQVKTIEVVDLFAMQGFYPVLAQEQRIVKVDRAGYQKHMIRLRHVDSRPILQGLHLEICLTNSHDGTCAYRLMAAIMRMVCTNGLIVSAGEFGDFRIPHVGFEPAMVREASSRFAEDLPALQGKVETYAHIHLTPEERVIFAESALMLKLDPPENVIPMRLENGIFQIDKREFNVPRLLEPVRQADLGDSLWQTYNILQEKLTKGNRYEVNKNPSSRGYWWNSRKRVRAITGIDETVRVNRGLWHLMSELAKIKAPAAA